MLEARLKTNKIRMWVIAMLSLVAHEIFGAKSIGNKGNFGLELLLLHTVLLMAMINHE